MKINVSKPQKAITPISFVADITKAYEKYGQSPSSALSAAQIAPELLKNPAACITAEQLETLSGYAMRELDDEALGWFSRRLPWGSHGMLCRASVTAPDLGVALKRWCRCHGLLTDDITLSLSTKGEVASIAITEKNIAPTMREICLVSVLRMVHGFACWLIDSRIPLSDLAFPFIQPPHAAVYNAMFPGRARFENETTGFSFDAKYLALPPVRDETATRQMLQKALPLTVLQYRRDRLLIDRVRQLLKTHLKAHAPVFPNAEVLAEQLAISSRTLHRQLNEEEASLQQIKNDVRRAHALELLQRTNRPLKQIAHMAGFRNEKSFSRAFRAWTGKTPGNLKK